jgi:hypothetical protein
MTSIHIARALLTGVFVLAVAGCTAAPPVPADPDPTSAPTDGTPAGPVCESTLFTDVMDAPDLTAETTPLEEVAFPLDGIERAGFDVLCTAHMVADYAEVDQIVEFDILVTDADWQDVLAALDESTAAQGWVRDGTHPVWRDPDDQNHYIETLGVEGGVLVGTTEDG